MVDKFKRETLEGMGKEELIEHILDLQQENWTFQRAYYIRPGGEYIVDSTRTKDGKIFRRIRYDYSKADESFSTFPKATKLVFFPKEYDNITETVRVKINQMHEVMYKKGYEWISSISITDCEIIPFGNKPEEKMEKLAETYRALTTDKTDDDYLF